MNTACRLMIALLVASMFLMGCDKIKELVGQGHDDAKSVEDCKTLALGMKTSEMLAIMGKPVSQDKGMGDKSGLMRYGFTTSSAATAVIVMADINTDEVVLLQCGKGYNQGDDIQR